MPNRLANLGTASSQWLGVLLFDGVPNETISSRAYKMRLQGDPWPERFVNALLFWDANHCEKAVNWESGKSRDQIFKD